MPRPVVSRLLALALLAASPALAQHPRLPALERLSQDESPAVRLEAVRALGRIPEARAAELALAILDQPMDPQLDYALWLTINELSKVWIDALESGAWKPEGRERQLEFALKAIPGAEASRVLAKVLAARPLDRAGSGAWIELIGQAGGPAELRLLLDRLVAQHFDGPAATRAARALVEAQRLRKATPAGGTAALGDLLNSTEPGVREAAAQWAGILKDASRVPRLGELVINDPTAPVRQSALNALRQIGGPPVIALLTRLASEGSREKRSEAIGALASVDPSAALAPALALLPEIPDEASALTFWRALLAQKGFGKSLADSIDARLAGGASRFIPEPVARAGMRAGREGGRNEVELVLALSKAAGLSAEAQQFTANLIRDLAARALQSGDPARGEMIYRRDAIGCVGCHAIGGAGGKVGPDMTSIGASAPADYLVESILLPNAKIKEGYHSVVLTLKDDSELVGTLARETPQEIVLRNAAGAEQAIAKADISKREQGIASLMPAGLIDPLTEQEQLDLYSFLSRLGKPGDYDASRGGIARRWRLTQTVHTDAQNGQESWPIAAPWTDKRWVHTFALVRGTITRPLIESVTKAQAWTSRLAVYAGTEIDVRNAGPTRFILGANPSAELWIDGKKAGGPGNSQVDLQPGRHRVLVKLDPKNLPDSLRLESPDVTFVME